MGKTVYLGTSYYRDGYIFECGNVAYFSVLLSMIAKADTVEDAISMVSKLKIDGIPLVKHIYKAEVIGCGTDSN